MDSIGKCILIPIESAIKTPEKSGVYRIYKNKWWIVTANKEILFYRGYSPQCNQQKETAEYLQKKLYPSLFVEFLDTVFKKEPQS